MTFDYLSCQKAEDGPYPAYFNLDISLCEFLAHNLRELATSPAVGTIDGWSDNAWKSFLLHHARRFEEYATYHTKYELSYSRVEEIQNRAKKSLQDISLFLPRLWD